MEKNNQNSNRRKYKHTQNEDKPLGTSFVADENPEEHKHAKNTKKAASDKSKSKEDKTVTQNILCTIFQNAESAKDLIKDFSPLQKKSELKKLLSKQDVMYDEFIALAKSQAIKFDVVVESINPLNKFLSTGRARMKLLTDKSTNKIAEVLLLWATNRMIAMCKLLPLTKKTNIEVGQLLDRCAKYEDESILLLKKFL